MVLELPQPVWPLRASVLKRPPSFAEFSLERLSPHEKRYFKRTDTGSKESLKKESIGSYDRAGGSDGKVRVDKTYRDPGTAIKSLHFSPSFTLLWPFGLQRTRC